MKRLLLVIAACLALGSSARSEPVRIMPLGDSITESTGGHASYRYWLWHDLLVAGYDVDFVGSETGVYRGQPLYPDFDQEHEGHWGWWTDWFFPELPAWAGAAQPDVVLLHLGTNDLFYWQSVASTISDLTQIVDILRVARPGVTVLLAQLIPGDTPRLDDIPWLNSEIAVLAPLLSSPDSPVIAVDHYTGFDPVADTWDGVHPDESGEQKISARWFDALENILSPATGAAQIARLGAAAELRGVFPNPFASCASVSFVLARSEHVRLTVHDVTGARVLTLFDGHRSAGAHRLMWEARSADGEALPGGVYFLRLLTESGAHTRKCVRVR